MGEKPTEADERKASDGGRPIKSEQRAGAGTLDNPAAGAAADPESDDEIAIDEEGVQRGAMNSIRNLKAREAGGQREAGSENAGIAIDEEGVQRSSNLNLSKSNLREGGSGPGDAAGIAVGDEGVPADKQPPKAK